jgi:hypothetical protein
MINVNIIPSYYHHYTIAQNRTLEFFRIYISPYPPPDASLLFGKHLFAFIYRSHIFPNYFSLHSRIQLWTYLIDMTKIFHRRFWLRNPTFFPHHRFHSLKVSISIIFCLRSIVFLSRFLSYQTGHASRLIREILSFFIIITSKCRASTFFRIWSGKHSRCKQALILSHTTGGKIFQSAARMNTRALSMNIL